MERYGELQNATQPNSTNRFPVQTITISINIFMWLIKKYTGAIGCVYTHMYMYDSFIRLI